jgi:hypothetical protein
MSGQEIALFVVNTTTQMGYTARFPSEDAALTWIEERKSTHVFTELHDEPVPDDAERLLDYLNPSCEHGLSASLCAGPGHYPPDLSY